MSKPLTLKSILRPRASNPNFFNKTQSTIGSYAGKKGKFTKKVKKYHGGPKGSLSAYMTKRKSFIKPRKIVPVFRKVTKEKGKI